MTSASVPANLGTGALQDVGSVLSTRHHLLFENGDGMPTQLKFEAALAGSNAVTSGFGFTTVAF